MQFTSSGPVDKGKRNNYTGSLQQQRTLMQNKVCFHSFVCLQESHHQQKPTLHQEEEADDSSGSDDSPRNDEGQSPR